MSGGKSLLDLLRLQEHWMRKQPADPVRKAYPVALTLEDVERLVDLLEKHDREEP